MTTMTITPQPVGDQPSNSWNDGYIDGQIAALTHLPSRRIHARASMADDHDPDYAQGLIDGYLHATAVNHAHLIRTLTDNGDINA